MYISKEHQHSMFLIWLDIFRSNFVDIVTPRPDALLQFIPKSVCSKPESLSEFFFTRFDSAESDCEYPLFEKVSKYLVFLSGSTEISKIIAKLDEIIALVRDKNFNYGNSALKRSVLSMDVPVEVGLRVRLSDKVSRLDSLLKGEQDRVGESLKDTVTDIVGYLILYWINWYILDEERFRKSL